MLEKLKKHKRISKRIISETKNLSIRLQLPLHLNEVKICISKAEVKYNLAKPNNQQLRQIALIYHHWAN